MLSLLLEWTHWREKKYLNPFLQRKFLSILDKHFILHFSLRKTQFKCKAITAQMESYQESPSALFPHDVTSRRYYVKVKGRIMAITWTQVLHTFLLTSSAFEPWSCKDFCSSSTWDCTSRSLWFTNLGNR